MYRLGLNQVKSNNYMFFDFEAPLCLSVSKNTGVVERLTPRILSAIKSKTLILIEGELPQELKDEVPGEETKSHIEAVEIPVDIVVPEVVEVTETIEPVTETIEPVAEVTEITEEAPKKKRGPRKIKTE